MSKSLNIKGLGAGFPALGRKLAGYAGFMFFLLLAIVYGYLLFRINSLSNAQPDPSAITSAQVASPHVDDAVAQRLQSLQDNSVNVQTLFNDARNNPFDE